MGSSELVQRDQVLSYLTFLIIIEEGQRLDKAHRPETGRALSPHSRSHRQSSRWLGSRKKRDWMRLSKHKWR